MRAGAKRGRSNLLTSAVADTSCILGLRGLKVPVAGPKYSRHGTVKAVKGSPEQLCGAGVYCPCFKSLEPGSQVP